MIKSIIRELYFLSSRRSESVAILFLFVVTSASVAMGLSKVADQIERLERVQKLQQVELDVLVSEDNSAGYAGYYTFHVTSKPISAMTFAALGQTDVFPSILRIRALAIEAQIYENERINPELALVGHFDFAFVLVYLAPLILIALLHDFRSQEQEAGRLVFLKSLPYSSSRVFAARIFIHTSFVAVALLLPLYYGSIYMGASLVEICIATLFVLGVVGFWMIVCWSIGRMVGSSTSHAATLTAIWFVITLVLPSLANISINALVPIPQGADIARNNRGAVHSSWDIPKHETMRKFAEIYPEWAKSSSITAAFDWRWYYAFQHLGDVHVAGESKAYRDGIARREYLSSAFAFFVPPIGFQRGLHSLAQTDVESYLQYRDKVRKFHTTIREFYYPYIFRKARFKKPDYAKIPKY